MDRRDIFALGLVRPLHRRVAALSFALGLALSASPVAAQGWFDQFFQPVPPPVQRFYAPAPRRDLPRPRPHPHPHPHPLVEHLVDKAPEKLGKDVTFVTAVIGDSLGQMLGLGLADTFTDRADVGVLRRARENTGLSRDDVFDWVKGTRDLLGGPEKISAAAMLVGSNDRQPIREGDTVYEPFTPHWTELYRARVAAIVSQFKARNVPLVWVGLPVVRSDRLAADFSKLNDIYREEAAKGGATFVDVWEGFADEHGQYSPVGPGTDGQVARLRSADGVHFTRAGSLKLAHFVEGDLRHDLDAATPGSPLPSGARDAAIPSSEAPAPVAPVAQQKPVAGPVLSLTGPPAATGGLLAQRGGVGKSGAATVTDQVLSHGEAPDTRAREIAP